MKSKEKATSELGISGSILAFSKKSKIGQGTIRKAIHNGSLPCVMIGRKILLRSESFEKWVATLEGKYESQATRNYRHTRGAK